MKKLIAIMLLMFLLCSAAFWPSGVSMPWNSPDNPRHQEGLCYPELHVSNGDRTGLISKTAMFLAGTNSLGRYVIQPKTLFKVNRYKLAYQATTNLVSDYLIHPAKAQFCSFDEMNITDGYKQFFVSGTVDGDDEHGTFLRNKFDLLLDSDGEGYKLTVHLLEFSPASN